MPIDATCAKALSAMLHRRQVSGKIVRLGIYSIGVGNQVFQAASEKHLPLEQRSGLNWANAEFLF